MLDSGSSEQDPGLNFRSAKLTEFLAYWQSKKSNQRFPTRSDIAPRDILPWLPMISMYDAPHQGEEFRIRLFGTALSEFFSQGDLRGRPISDLPPAVYARKRRALDHVMNIRAPLRTFVEKTVIPGQDFQSLEACYAPLSSNGSDIDVIIVLMQLGTHY